MLVRLFKTRKTFQLSRYFSIASLVTIILAAVILSWMYRVVAVDDLIQQGENDNIVLAQTFSNAIWSQVKFLLEGPADNHRLQENQLHFNTLHDSVQKLIKDTPVLKIMIIDLKNHAAYSTNRGQVGDIIPGDFAGRVAATGGKTITELDFNKSFVSLRGPLLSRYILSSYLPMRDPSSNEIRAVIGIFTDVTDLYNDIIDSRNAFAIAVVTILGLVYLVLFFLVRHADQIIRSQADEREKYLDEIKTINEDLDKNAKELAIAHDKAVEASTSKSQFLANMSHELRTPLNAIIGYSEMLTEEMDPKKQKNIIQDLEKIQLAGKHLLTLINEILDISKAEAGRIHLHLEEFDIHETISSIITTIQPLARKGDNTFKVKCPKDIGFIYSDITRFRQILFNLLSNACKFTTNGSITLQVSRTGEEELEHISIVVTDTGIGINTNKLDKIFEPFQQADASTTRKYGGTGLGLTISKRFCELLGGSIRVESEPDKGTRFIVKLPIRAIAEEEEDDKSRVRLPDSTDTSMEQRNDFVERRRKISRILLIDDDPDTRELCLRYLEKSGFDVITAENGQEGLHLARLEKPDIITLDVMMPGKDGWSTLQEMKQDPLLREIPIIMLSIISEQEMGYSLGAADYLTKPVEWHRLGNTIRKWLRMNSQ